jgi:hypothetical protein
MNLDRVFVMICSVAIAIGIVAIAAMLLAALAFANGTTVGIPLVATFDGLREISSAPTVTITGSWIAAGIVTAVLALPLWIVALRYRSTSSEITR